jgi:hypothetical protein
LALCGLACFSLTLRLLCLPSLLGLALLLRPLRPGCTNRATMSVLPAGGAGETILTVRFAYCANEADVSTETSNVAQISVTRTFGKVRAGFIEILPAARLL